MPSYNSIAVNTVYVNENPWVFIVGSTPIFNFVFLGTGTLSSPSCRLFRGKEEVASKLLGSQADPVGRTVTTKQLNLDTAGDYELYVFVTDGGMVRPKALRIMVRKLGVY